MSNLHEQEDSPNDEIIASLIKLSEHTDSDIRERAVYFLGKWVEDTNVVNCLFKRVHVENDQVVLSSLIDRLVKPISMELENSASASSRLATIALDNARDPALRFQCLSCLMFATGQISKQQFASDSSKKDLASIQRHSAWLSELVSSLH
jgi:hypothetical protein